MNVGQTAQSCRQHHRLDLDMIILLFVLDHGLPLLVTRSFFFVEVSPSPPVSTFLLRSVPLTATSLSAGEAATGRPALMLSMSSLSFSLSFLMILRHALTLRPPGTG